MILYHVPGGMLSLVAGVSVLGIFELLFWIAAFFFGRESGDDTSGEQSSESESSSSNDKPLSKWNLPQTDAIGYCRTVHCCCCCDTLPGCHATHIGKGIRDGRPAMSLQCLQGNSSPQGTINFG